MGKVKDPPTEGTLGVPGGTKAAYVLHGGDPPGVDMDNPGPDSEGENQHERH